MKQKIFPAFKTTLNQFVKLCATTTKNSRSSQSCGVIVPVKYYFFAYKICIFYFLCRFHPVYVEFILCRSQMRKKLYLLLFAKSLILVITLTPFFFAFTFLRHIKYMRLLISSVVCYKLLIPEEKKC